LAEISAGWPRAWPCGLAPGPVADLARHDLGGERPVRQGGRDPDVSLVAWGGRFAFRRGKARRIGAPFSAWHRSAWGPFPRAVFGPQMAPAAATLAQVSAPPPRARPLLQACGPGSCAASQATALLALLSLCSRGSTPWRIPHTLRHPTNPVLRPCFGYMPTHFVRYAQLTSRVAHWLAGCSCLWQRLSR